MTERTPIFQALQPQIIGAGLQPDIHQVQKTLWEVAENVVFHSGKVRRRLPSTLMFDTSADPIRGITQHQDTDGVRWVWAAAGNKVYRWYGPAVNLIYTSAGWTENQTANTPATYWDMLPYGNWMIMNYGVGQARVYKPEVPSLAALGDIPADVVTMLKKHNFIVNIGYGAAKTRVGWSNGDIIDEYTAAADSLAGSLTLAEFNSPIRAAAHLGEAIAIYGEDQMALLNYIGSPFYFGFKFRLDGIGAVGKAAVASDGKNNVGVSRNGIWWTDSLTYKYIDEGALHDYLQENVNWAQSSKIVACRNDVTGCFEFCFPMGASTTPSEAWSFDPRTAAWSEVPAFSFKDERKLFNRPLVGDLAGQISLDADATSGNTLDLVTKPLLAQLQHETGLLDLHTNAHVTEVDILLKEASNVQFRLGASQEPNTTYTYTPWIDLAAGAQSYKIPRGLPSGVYHKLAFRSTSTTWTLDLQGFELFGNVEGTKRRALT